MKNYLRLFHYDGKNKDDLKYFLYGDYTINHKGFFVVKTPFGKAVLKNPGHIMHLGNGEYVAIADEDDQEDPIDEFLEILLITDKKELLERGNKYIEKMRRNEGNLKKLN